MDNNGGRAPLSPIYVRDGADKEGAKSEIVAEVASTAGAEPVIVERLSQFIERFVYVPHYCFYRLIALWVIASYLHKRFDYTGYLFFHSSVPQSGKSRMLEVLDTLVFNSTGIMVSPSEAVLFRTAQEGTQLLDEVDSWTNRDALRSVLNTGFHNGGIVPRMADQEGNYKVERYLVYAPRVLAGIGNGILHDTTRDRTFSIEMARQKPSEKREQFRLRRIGEEAKALTARIEQWSREHGDEISECYEKPDPPYLTDFRDRTIDIAHPLATILEVAYSGQPDLEQVRIDFVEAVSMTRADEESLGEEHRILRELAHLAEIEDPLIGNASELAARLKGYDESMISQTLRKYGFEQRSIRVGGEDPRYRYVMPRTRLSDIVDRYATPRSPAMRPKAAPPVPPASNTIP